MKCVGVLGVAEWSRDIATRQHGQQIAASDCSIVRVASLKNVT